MDIEVVSSLPTTDISTTTIYLLSGGADTGNLYEEYLYVNNAWEKLGAQSITIPTPDWAESSSSSANYIANKPNIQKGTDTNGTAVKECTGTTASNVNSHAEGGGSVASGANSHSEGSGTTASNVNSHAEG